VKVSAEYQMLVYESVQVYGLAPAIVIGGNAIAVACWEM